MKLLNISLAILGMPRKRASNRDKLLTKAIFIRMTEDDYKKLDKLVSESNCSSVSEAARKVLFQKKIISFHKDVTRNGPMEELASIRKELKAIGININQITKAFHTTSDPERKYVYSMKAFNKNQQIAVLLSQQIRPDWFLLSFLGHVDAPITGCFVSAGIKRSVNAFAL